MRWRMGAGMAKPNFYDRLAELDRLLKAGPGAADGERPVHPQPDFGGTVRGWQRRRSRLAAKPDSPE